MKFRCFRFVVTPEDLINLKSHKYESKGRGILEPFVHWFASNLCVSNLPKVLTPNFINLVGFTFHLFGTLLVISTDQGSLAYMVSDIRSAFYIIVLFAFGLLSSAAGAQARRLGSPNALGELLDHGLDACTMGLVILSVAAVLRYSFLKKRLHLFCFTGNLLFLVTHWRAFSFGYLTFYRIGPVEGQYFVQFLFLLNVVFGADFAWFELPSPWFIHDYLHRRAEIIDLIYWDFIAFSGCSILKQLYEIATVMGSRTFAGASTFSPLVWILSTVLLWFLNFKTADFFINDYLIQVEIVTIIAPLVKLSWTLIICYMARCSVPSLDTCLLPSLLMFLWLVCLKLELLLDCLAHGYLFHVFCAASILDLIYFAVSNVYIISKALNCPVLSMQTVIPPSLTSSSLIAV